MLLLIWLPAVPPGVFAILSGTIGAIVAISAFQGLKRWGLAAIFILLGVGEYVMIDRADESNKTTVTNQQKQIDELPAKVAEYIRNTSPQTPSTLTATVALKRPPAATGLLAFVAGDEGTTAVNLSRQIFDLLNKQGDPPIRNSGESQIDFIVRSNAWYADLLAKYKKAPGPQVQSFIQYLVGIKVLTAQSLKLAENPVNLMGIKEIAAQLDSAAAAMGTSPPPTLGNISVR